MASPSRVSDAGARAGERQSGVLSRARLGGQFWEERLLAHAMARPAATAVTHYAASGACTQVSYEALLGMARGYARLFVETTPPRQIIPLCLERGPECTAAILGALLAERAFCCVHPKLRAPQQSHIFAQLASPIALVDSAGLTSLRGLLGAGQLAEASHEHLRRTAWVLAPEPGSRPRVARHVLEELARHAEVRPHAPLPYPDALVARVEPAAPDAVACCLFTSGSTGTPKGVLVGHDDLPARALGEVAWFGLAADDVLLNVLPLSFDVGLNQWLSAVIAGAELVVTPSWLPADVLKVSAERGVTGISAVPSIWAGFLARGLGFDTEGAHRALRYLTVSGGDLTPAQHAAMASVARGVRVFKTYGQTESFRTTSLHPEEYPRFPTSIGRALPGVTLRIVRDDGSPAEVGEVGELVHGGVGTMLGYLDGSHVDGKLRAVAEAGALLERDVVVHTGDLGYRDDEGRVYLVGRRDDLVKIDGNRVYPREVQHLLAHLPGVLAAEVVALRDEHVARLAAFVVPAPGATLDGDALRRTLSAQAPSYMVPALWSVLPALPHTDSGKPDRHELAQRARALVSPAVVTSRAVVVGGGTEDRRDER